MSYGAITHAELALRLAKLGRLISGAQVSMAEGMHNPNFCSADARPYGRSIIDDLQREVAYLDRRLNQDDRPDTADQSSQRSVQEKP